MSKFNEFRSTILVVEDDPTSLILLEKFLKHNDIKVLKAQNGQQALEQVKNNDNISIVLMDIKMPGIDGNEATRKIKEINENIFVIAQTAYVSRKDKKAAIEAGCDDFIEKPIRREILFEIIKKFQKELDQGL